MQFDLSLDKIIGTQAKIKLLRYLFGHQAPMSENELAKVVKVSHMTVNRLMKELRDLNLVNMERVGNAHVWTTNKESYAYLALSQTIKEVSSAPPAFEHLKETLSKNIPRQLVKKAVLFGSVAEGKSRVNSDIDLFILVKSQKETEELTPHIDKLSNLCLALYGNRLAPYILTEAELQEKKKLPLLKEIGKGVQII